MAVAVERDFSATTRIREVSRAFQMVDAEHNPITSMMKKVGLPGSNSTLIEYPLRRVAKATTAAGLKDGVAVDPIADGKDYEDRKVLLQARPQRHVVPWAVGEITNRMTQQYGLNAPTKKAEYVKLALEEARSAMELIVLKNVDSQAETGSVPYLTRGITYWIGKGNAGDLPLASSWSQTPATSIFTTAGSSDAASVITEANIRAVMQSIYEASRRKGNWILFADPDFAETFNNYVTTGAVSETTAPLRRFAAEAKDGTITLDVRKYVSTWGTLTIVPHLDLPTKVFGILLNMDMLHWKTVKPPTNAELENRGAGENGFIDFIGVLACDNPTAHGKFLQKA